MAAPVGFLLLWGITLGPVSKAATWIETRPSLWAESASPLKPWAQLKLTCGARLETLDFQLLKGGVALEQVHLDTPAIAHQFVLGEVSRDNQGLYHCRAGLGEGWTQLSDLVEVTGTEPLPPPRLSAEPVSWITPGLNSTLRCRAAWHSVTFLLRREGDRASPAVAKAGDDREATFLVHRAGNYSCSYRIHAVGSLSEPSDMVTIEELAAPLPPALEFSGEGARVLRPGERASLRCVAPVSGVDFELLRRGEALRVSMSSTSLDRVFFHLDWAVGDSGPYTCRYRPLGAGAAWSADSAPVELVRSDDEQVPKHRASHAPRAPRPLSPLSCRVAACARPQRRPRRPAPRARLPSAPALPHAQARAARGAGARGRAWAPAAGLAAARWHRGRVRTARRLCGRLCQLQLRLHGPGAALRGLRAQRSPGAAGGRAPARAAPPGLGAAGDPGPRRRPALRGLRARRGLRAAASGRGGRRSDGQLRERRRRPGADRRWVRARGPLQLPLPCVGTRLRVAAQRAGGAAGGGRLIRL